MGKAAASKPVGKVAKSAATAVKTRVKDVQGLRAAKKATSMTREQWLTLQKGMAEKWPAPAYMQQKIEGKSHNCYRDETFELMSRFHAGTKITYRPHAKAPGSAGTPNKSHVRYEKYMGAKTAAQALVLGAWPADWCWDFERGFIRVDKSTLREEPIDISQVTDESKLTDVDNAVYQWYRKELARKLGLSYKDLFVDKGSQESTIMRAHRLVAQREAKGILAACEKAKRKVSDSELTTVLTQWGFARNPNRVNVMREGQSWVWSDTLGLLRDRIGDIHLTQSSEKYPEFVGVINKWLMDRLPADMKPFVWTSLNVNKNYAAYIHRDGNNFGPSMISAFGDFTGGELNYYPDDDGKGEPGKLLKGTHKKDSFDLGNGLALFNGNSAHSVNDFEGNRFSIVFFTLGCHAKMKDADRAGLGELGFAVPKSDQDPHELLRPPCKKRAPASPTSKSLPAVRYWSKAALAGPRTAGQKRKHA